MSTEREAGWYWTRSRESDHEAPMRWEQYEKDLFCIRGERIPSSTELAAQAEELAALRELRDACGTKLLERAAAASNRITDDEDGEPYLAGGLLRIAALAKAARKQGGTDGK